MMNLKVTTFSSKQHKSLKITPSTIIVKVSNNYLTTEISLSMSAAKKFKNYLELN